MLCFFYCFIFSLFYSRFSALPFPLDIRFFISIWLLLTLSCSLCFVFWSFYLFYSSFWSRFLLSLVHLISILYFSIITFNFILLFVFCCWSFLCVILHFSIQVHVFPSIHKEIKKRVPVIHWNDISEKVTTDVFEELYNGLLPLSSSLPLPHFILVPFPSPLSLACNRGKYVPVASLLCEQFTILPHPPSASLLWSWHNLTKRVAIMLLSFSSSRCCYDTARGSRRLKVYISARLCNFFQ